MHTDSNRVMQEVLSDSLLGILQYWLSDEVKTQVSGTHPHLRDFFGPFVNF